MTERTFREPSPNRGGPPTHAENPPPVPALPRSYVAPPPVPERSIRRPASVEPPERVRSPPPKVTGGRGVSLDRGPGVMASRLNKKPGSRVTSLNSVDVMEQPDDRRSVNFSRPMSPQNSPPSTPLKDPRAQDREVENIKNFVQEEAARPVKKKKKVVAKSMAEGSHLAAGSVGGKPTGTALAATPKQQPPSNLSKLLTSDVNPQAIPADDAPKMVPKKSKKATTPISSSHGPDESSYTNYASDSDSVSEPSLQIDRPRTYNTRAAGLLMKQPSIVREDREGEEKEERGNVAKGNGGQLTLNGSPGHGKVLATSPKTSTTTIAPQQTRPTGQTTPLLIPSAINSTSNSGRSITNFPGSRQQSLSPARAAHFSSQPMYETPDGVRHQPPPRSVSPAKSALKYSSTSRGNSPAGNIPGSWNRQAPSEASDTPSVVSDDGTRSVTKKKKNVRVSFDDDSVAVGRAASPPPTSPDSALTLSPQHNGKSKKGWLSVAGGKKQSPSSEAETVMKPTPALPSFGSVGPRKDQEESMVTSGQQNRQNTVGGSFDNMGTSNDQVVGSVLSQNFATKDRGPVVYQPSQLTLNDPIPPEVISVEGTGYDSDMEDDDRDAGDQSSSPTEKDQMPNDHDAPRGGLASAESAVEDSSSQLNNDLVPLIAVQPATPKINDLEPEPEEWLKMPGEFPASGGFSYHKEATAVVEHHATDPTPATIGIAEPEPEGVTAQHDPASPAIGDVAESLRHQTEVREDDESDDTANSIYSDAAEDLSDLEGDGFGSINAIVESPSGRSPVNQVSTPDIPDMLANIPVNVKSKLSTRRESTLSDSNSEEGWDQAQAYWSGLSQSRKRQLERAAIPGAADEDPSEPAIKAKTALQTSSDEPKPKIKKKKSVAKDVSQTTSSTQPPLPPWPDKQYRDETTKSTSSRGSEMKQSMRGPKQAVAEPSHMRSSMRDGAALKSSLRPKSERSSVQPSGSPEPRGALQKKYRPVSAVAMVDYNKFPAQPVINHNRAASDGIASKSLTPVSAHTGKKASTAKSGLSHTMSNDSDSSSSFRKQKRPSTSDGSRYTMKRTMRSASVDERPQSAYAGQSSAFSVRSLSPTGSTTRRPFSSAGPGMRSSMRGSIDSDVLNRTKSPPRSFGLGKGSKTKSTAPKGKKQFSSRFQDSSDEEDGPKSYGSRFVDSSDEEEPRKLPANLTPVRGIPRRIDEGDSTDLEDSSVDGKTLGEKAKSPGLPKLEGAALATGSLRSNANGQGDPLSKTAEMGFGLQAKKAAEKDKKSRSFFGGRGKKRDESKLRTADSDVAVRRVDPPLEPNKADKILGSSSPAQSPKSPKLQRRNTPKRLMSDSWPLPQSPATDSRPNTSDGAVVNGRPEIGARRVTEQGERLEVNGVGVVGKTGKKKRFPLLRKAFGLKD